MTTEIPGIKLQDVIVAQACAHLHNLRVVNSLELENQKLHIDLDRSKKEHEHCEKLWQETLDRLKHFHAELQKLPPESALTGWLKMFAQLHHPMDKLS